MHKNILTLIIAVFGGAASAFAIPSTLSVDLRTAGWKSSNGQSQDTVGNLTATAVAPAGSTLTWSATAGLGISSPPSVLGLGTVDILNLTFGNGSGNGLSGAWVTNLFNGLIDEVGLLVLKTTTGTDILNFSGLETQSQDPLGDVFVSFGSAHNVLSAQFYEAGELNSLLSGKNYSVAGFTSVPDGGRTVTLLGLGLLSLVVFRRRFAF
jgi:hypothetical protein